MHLHFSFLIPVDFAFFKSLLFNLFFNPVSRNTLGSFDR